MIFLLASSLIATNLPLFVAVRQAPNDLSTLLDERPSVQHKRQASSVAARHRADASEHRVADRTRAHTHWQSFNASVSHATRVASLPVKPVAPSIPAAIWPATQTVKSFVADVRVKVQDERGQPISGRTVLVSVTRGDQAVAFDHGRAGWLASRGGAGYVAGAASLPVKNGYVEIRNVSVPAAISVKLPDGVSDEWSIVGDEGAGAVVIGDGSKAETGTVAISPTASGTIVEKHADAPVVRTNLIAGRPTQKVRLTVKHETDRVSIEMPETVTLRREVADFVVPKPTVVAADKDAKAHLFLGQEKEGAGGFNPENDGSNWTFRVRRNDLGEDSKLVVQADTANGSFGGEIPLGKVDFYESNRLSQAPALELEAIANPKIVLVGKTVDDSFRLSPIQWRSEGGGKPVLTTGKDALATLGVSEADVRIVTPDAGKKDNRGKYGQWLYIDRLGIALHCRYDSDQNPKNQVLPDDSTHGLLEAIRVTNEAGGKVGEALFVGAARKDVEGAFGRPDPALEHLDRINLGDGAKATAIYGDAHIEAASETYLYGGLRVGYHDDKVAWFEIARPVQLLYDGARAFVPDEAHTIAIGEVSGEPPSAVNRLRDALLRVAANMSGMRLAESGEHADSVLTGHISASKHSRIYEVTEAYTDGEGVERQHTDKYEQGPDGKLTEKIIEDRMRRPLHSWASNASNVLGTVLAVNYDTGQLLINLGKRQGVRSKADGGENTEFALFLIHNVNLKTGETVDIINAPVLAGSANGQKRDEWLEVQSVGEDWCVTTLRKLKDRKNKNGKSVVAEDQIARLVDPGSGLLRVRIVAKRRKK